MHDHDAPSPHEHDHTHGHHGPEHDHDHPQQGDALGWLQHTFAHSHDVHEKVDAAMVTHERGIWAIELSLPVLTAHFLEKAAKTLAESGR